MTPLIPADAIHAGLLDQIDTVRDFIANHPSFPVTAVDVHAGGFAVIRKFCATPAEVDRIAASIGVAARWRNRTQYIARLRGCGQVCDYEVIYVVHPEADSQDPAPVREMAGSAA